MSAWRELVDEQVADVLAALIRRTGGDMVELSDGEIAKRAPGEVVEIRYDEDGCVRVEITREVQQ